MEIRLPYQHKQTLAKEFRVTPEAVRQSLNYMLNSTKANQIRKRAKELLQEEIEKIDTETINTELFPINKI